MTAAKEVAAVNDAYARAVAAYGASVATNMLAEWGAVTRFSPAGRARLVTSTLALTKSARTVLARLALRRAQLVQALQVGTQLHGGPDQVSTLQDLRDAYAESLREAGLQRAKRSTVLDPSTVIPVVPEDGSLEGLLEAVNGSIDQEIEGTISNLGERRLLRIARREGIVSADHVNRSRTMTASGIERIALNGGRDTDAEIIQLNKQVIGYTRVHNAHSADMPCPFCAMLLSRGAVYLSAQTAGEGHKYHANCHCTAEAVYSVSDWENNPRYALNRAMQAEWKSGNFHGPEALSDWRKHITEYFATQTAVQVAA